MRNTLLGLGFFALFGTVVVTYPSYADNDLMVLAVVAVLLVAGLAGILLSGRGNAGGPPDAR